MLKNTRPAHLRPHPRLYIGPKEIARLKQPPTGNRLTEETRLLQIQARKYLESTRIAWTPRVHNGHLIRARTMQVRLVALLIEWLRTGEGLFRDAAVAHVLEMGRWKYWSWITWREGNSDPNAIFDLSYGENSATLAIAYDLLHPTLSPREKQTFLAIAKRRALAPCLKHIPTVWWAQRHFCNWLGVCAGGAGMLALAMHDDLPEAPPVLDFADEAIRRFFADLKATGGAWPEGIVYWNYGMRYAFMYLLSWEHATGRNHPVFRQPEIRNTLLFPMAFCPHGAACGFGDANAPWKPLAFHYAAAERLGLDQLPAFLDETYAPGNGQSWPSADYLVLRPRLVLNDWTSDRSGLPTPYPSKEGKLTEGTEPPTPVPSKEGNIIDGPTPSPSKEGKLTDVFGLFTGGKNLSLPSREGPGVGSSSSRSTITSQPAGPVVQLYKGISAWGWIADRPGKPGLYLSVRGGSTEVPHGHLDLLSYHCIVNDEQMISSLANTEYLDTTFSDRRFDIAEMNPPAKNTVLIGGVGIAKPATVASRIVKFSGAAGIRLDARNAFRIVYQGKNCVRFVGRLFLMLGKEAILILDRVELKHPNRIETRLHSFAKVTSGKQGARLTGKRQRLRVLFAASAPCLFRTAVTAPTRPQDPSANVLRWATEDLQEQVTLATLLVPGAGRASIALAEKNGGIVAVVTMAGRHCTLRFSKRLRIRACAKTN